jgi:plastocyanin
MKPRRTLWSLVALLGACGVACGEPADDRIPGPDLLAETSVEIVETVEVGERGFAPDEITVVAGDGIELINTGTEAHGFDGGDAFGTGLLEPGEKSTLVLVESGEYEYVDPADRSREGTIVVEPDPDDPATDSDP